MDKNNKDICDYKIRLAIENDCQELSKLKHTVWQTTYRGIYSDGKIDDFDFEKNKNKFMDIIKNPDIELYVVEYNEKLIGYVDYGVPLRPFENYKQEIGLLYILKEYQGLGIGRKLFDLAYNKIKEKGYGEFFISCNKYNIPAQKFYEKMGGRIVDIDKDSEDKSIPQVRFLYNVS